MTASSRKLRIQMFRACMAVAMLLFLVGLVWACPADAATGAVTGAADTVSLLVR